MGASNFLCVAHPLCLRGVKIQTLGSPRLRALYIMCGSGSHPEQRSMSGIISLTFNSERVCGDSPAAIRGGHSVTNVVFHLQRIREDMTLVFRNQEVGSWKLEVGFSQLCSLVQKRTPGPGYGKGLLVLSWLNAKTNFQLPTSSFLKRRVMSSRIRCT
jgi:hypothetical protein